jgi:hypothetical protein
MTMLRIHCPQQWYQLSDPAMEDVLYENLPMRRFSGLSLDAAIPDHISRVDHCHSGALQYILPPKLSAENLQRRIKSSKRNSV